MVLFYLRLLTCFVAILTLSCTESPGIPHPTDRLHFPGALAADPNGDYLYVVSSNFDLRYRGGAVTAIDLNTHRLIEQGVIGIGDFGGQLVLYEPPPDGDDSTPRLVGYLPSRSEGRLYWFEVNGGQADAPLRLGCNEEGPTEGGGIQECDNSHRVGRVERKRLPFDDQNLDEDARASLAGRPVSMSVGLDAVGTMIYPGVGDLEDHLIITNPRTGRVSAFHIQGGMPMSPSTPGAPAHDDDFDDSVLSRPGQPVFLENRVVSGGAYDLALSPSDGLVYTTNRFAGLVVPLELNAHPDPAGLPRTWTEIAIGDPFAIPSSGTASDHGRSMLFSLSGNLAYLSYRNPSGVVVIDTSLDSTGKRRNKVLGSIGVGAGPARLAAAKSGQDGRELLYVVCFGAEQIWVVDPVLLTVVDIIDLPGGPFDLAIVDNPERGRFRAYVSMFELEAVAVIDLDRESPFYHQVIAYIRGGHEGGVQ